MISLKNSSRRKFMCAMLLMSISLMANCAPEATLTPKVVKETRAVEVPAEAKAPEPAAPTATPQMATKAPEPALPTPPPDLDPAEGWQPYPQEIELMGDAELALGYEPMRLAVAAINPELREMLLRTGMKINTARTVVLSEPTNLSQPTGFDLSAVLAGFAEHRVDHSGVRHTALLVHDNARWHRGASEPWPFRYASTSTATATDCPGAATGTYVTTEDNEDNNYTGVPDGDMGGSEPPCVFKHHVNHPIEFYIEAASLPPGFSEAWLSLRVWDVDEQYQECPERDAVYFNGNFVGYLWGADEETSTSGPYELDPAWVLQGNNLVEIEVNTDDCLNEQGEGRWCVKVEQGALQLEGGTGAAYKRSFLQSPRCWPPGSAGYVQVEVDTTLDSQEVMVEINVIDAQNNVAVGDSQTGVIFGAEDDWFEFGLPIPANAYTGDYTIQVIIYDTCSGTIQETQEHTVRIDCAALEETVAIAPVLLGDQDLYALDQAKLEELFDELLATEGVVLGMLVLETNVPDSLIPSGAYLERAWIDGNQGYIELIDVISGETVYDVELMAKEVEDPMLMPPSASIFLGSKTCLTCLWRWYICRDCFFWEKGMPLKDCEEILKGLP